MIRGAGGREGGGGRGTWRGGARGPKWAANGLGGGGCRKKTMVDEHYAYEEMRRNQFCLKNLLCVMRNVVHKTSQGTPNQSTIYTPQQHPHSPQPLGQTLLGKPNWTPTQHGRVKRVDNRCEGGKGANLRDLGGGEGVGEGGQGGMRWRSWVLYTCVC